MRSYDKLTAIAELIHRYLPSVKSIGSFCSLYKNECSRMSPMEEFEEDLKGNKRTAICFR